MRGVSANFLILCALTTAIGAALFTGFLTAPAGVFVFVACAWMVSLCLHEFGHAITAHHGGDVTMVDKGYLTLDPARYVDPLTSLVLPLIVMAAGGFGFPGAAVYVRRDLIRSPTARATMSLAGPAANGLVLVATALPFTLGLPERFGAEAFWAGLAFIAFLQATAMLFNLLPVPGFDGYGVIEPFLPRNLAETLNRYAGIIMLGFIAIIFAANEILAPVFYAAQYLLDGFRVNLGLVGYGLDLFRFWDAQP